MALACLWTALAFATSTIFVAEAWAVSAFQALACILLAFTNLRGGRPWILVLPAFGLLQLALGTSIYPHATMQAILHWLSLGAVFLVAREASNDDAQRHGRFLDAFVAFAAFEAVLCLAQLHTSNGRVLWFIPSGYDDYVYGTFTSYNNFAQFAELAIPIAIVQSFQNRRFAGWHVLAAGLLYAAIIASTSRSGALIATGELLAIPILMARRRRGQWRQAALTLSAIPALALLWTAAAGWDRLLQRFAAGDLAAGRREFLHSALDMAVDKPFTGHGLGTFPYAYPRFAHIDLAEFVNHAHNDWAEFAADGGFLFALAVFAFFVWASRRLPANPWALGIAAVVIHAAVDYPFARPGVAGWIFALLGLLARPAAVEPARIPSLRWATAGFAAAGCAAAAWFGAADVTFRLDTPESIARAASMTPGNAEYWLRLSQRSHAPKALERALSLNPRDSRVLIEAGLNAELDGDQVRAGKLLLDAAMQDKGWLPRWSLANFYFRREQPSGFWQWGRSAAAVSTGMDLKPLFRLATNLVDNPETISGKLLPDRAEPLREFVTYVIQGDPKETRGLASVSRRLLQCGVQSPDTNYVVAVVERFIQTKQGAPARELWQALVDRGWLPASKGQEFDAKPLGEAFDWRMYPVDGIVVSSNPGAITVSFSGKQPDSWSAVQRVACVEPHARYRLKLQYSTEGISTSGPSGLRWRILDEVTGKELGRSAPLVAADLPREQILEFEAADSQLVRMQFLSEREPGTMRTNGAIRLSAAELAPAI